VTNRRRAQVDNDAVSVEDRLKLTPAFSLIGGLRYEYISLERYANNFDGTTRCVTNLDGTMACFPFFKKWTPTTGRAGYTWEAVPGLILYSQYATAADLAAATFFNLQPNQPLNLTTSRIYETGIKHLLWDRRIEWTLAAYDIERRNVYSSKNNQTVAVAGRVASKGIEAALAIRPIDGWKFWANVAFVKARYLDFQLVDSDGVITSFSGKTPPNVPHAVVNGGASFRFPTLWPVEVGGSIRHVSDRFVFDDNFVVMKAYTTADVFVFIDLPKWVFASVHTARFAFRVRNLMDRQYVVWADPGYPDQVILGPSRSFEVAGSFKF
jgi:iron complex outermembrane receptor protein